MVGIVKRVRGFQGKSKNCENGAGLLLIADYFEKIKHIITNSRIIIDEQLTFREFDINEGMITGRIHFLGGYLLELMEYIVIGKAKPKYRFHFQGGNNNLIFRYDNSPHFKDVNTFPHHKHDGIEKRVVDSKEINLIDVLKEVEKFIVKK